MGGQQSLPVKENSQIASLPVASLPVDSLPIASLPVDSLEDSSVYFTPVDSPVYSAVDSPSKGESDRNLIEDKKIEVIEEEEEDKTQKLSSKLVEQENDDCITKTIFVLHLAEENSQSVDLNQEPCLSPDTQNYDVQYTQILYDQNFENSVKIFSLKVQSYIGEKTNRCFALLIYDSNPAIPNESLAFLISNILPFLLNKYITLYKILNEEKENPFPWNLFPIKVRNIIKIPSRSIQYSANSRYRIGDYDFLYVDSLEITEAFKDGCSWWFLYYLFNAFNCAKGRLVQFSGTCQTNVVFNGFILSQYARKIILLKLLEKDDQTKEEAKKPIEQLENTQYDKTYFYRLLYNALCRAENLSDKLEANKDMDLICSYLSKNFNLSDLMMIDDPLINYLKRLKIINNENRKPSVITVLYLILKYVENNGIVSVLIGFPTGMFLYNFYSKGQSYFIYKSINNNTVHKTFENENDKYTCEFAIIELKNESNPISHVILGYKCNNILKVYDSNNFFYNWNWQDLKSSDNVAKLLSDVNKRYDQNYTIVKLDCAFYVHDDVKFTIDDMFSICRAI